MKKGLFVCILAVLLFVVMPAFAGGTEEAAGGEVTITWPTHWVGEQGTGPIVEKMVSEFNEANAGEIKVVLEAHPEADAAEEVIRTRLAARQTPDFFLFKLGPSTRGYYDSNLLLDLTDELKKDGWGASFNPGALGVSTINGKVKSLPMENALTPVWYNKSLFDKAGVAEFPKDMNAFWAAAEKLKAIGVVPTSQMTGGANAWTSMLWFTHFLGSYGGPNAWELGWDGPAFEKAAAIMKRLYTDGNTTLDAIGAGPGESSAHYMNERTAMFINGPWFVANIRQNAPAVYKETVLTSAPAAGDYSGHQVGWLLTSAAAANTDDPARKAAVLDFFRYITSPESSKRRSIETGSLIPVQFEINPEDNIDPLQQQFIQAGNNATFLIDGIEAVMPVNVVQEFGQALSSMVLQDLSPKEFIELMKAAGN